MIMAFLWIVVIALVILVMFVRKAEPKPPDSLPEEPPYREPKPGDHTPLDDIFTATNAWGQTNRVHLSNYADMFNQGHEYNYNQMMNQQQGPGLSGAFQFTQTQAPNPYIGLLNSTIFLNRTWPFHGEPKDWQDD